MEAAQLIRTDSTHPDFPPLVALLDQDLRIRDGEDHAFFAQFNGIAHIRHVVLLYLHGEPVACGAFKEFSADTAEVKRMYVLPTQRGKGLALLVLREVERWAAEEGYQRCILETGIKQPEAIRLYEKAAYTRIPNFPPYEAVATSVCMERRIGAA
jgi:putative acetyltransferase